MYVLRLRKLVTIICLYRVSDVMCLIWLHLHVQQVHNERLQLWCPFCQPHIRKVWQFSDEGSQKLDYDCLSIAELVSGLLISKSPSNTMFFSVVLSPYKQGRRPWVPLSFLAWKKLLNTSKCYSDGWYHFFTEQKVLSSICSGSDKDR